MTTVLLRFNIATVMCFEKRLHFIGGRKDDDISQIALGSIIFSHRFCLKYNLKLFKVILLIEARE